MKRGYLEKNPISNIEMSPVKLGEVQVYTPDEVHSSVWWIRAGSICYKRSIGFGKTPSG